MRSARARCGWLAAFLFLYYFSPGFGTPLYFHMTDHLRFSQGFIGLLSSISAGGWIVGGLLYRYLPSGISTRRLLNWSILAGTVSTLAFLGMVDPASAVVVWFFSGVAGMIANIATLTLAADHCPPRSEGFAFAALMSVINLATPLHDTIGAFLYDHVFHQGMAPLIVVSAAVHSGDLSAGAAAGSSLTVKGEQACAGRGTPHACSYGRRADQWGQ